MTWLSVSELFSNLIFDQEPSRDNTQRLRFIEKRILEKYAHLISYTLIGLNGIGIAFKDLDAKKTLKSSLKIGDLGFEKAFQEAQNESIRLPIEYNGKDLQELSIILNLSINEIIDLHQMTVFEVGMLGFLPGFPYLLGLDSRLKVPRKSIPDKYLKAGTVAIADKFCGIYPIDSPGGWWQIGQCPISLFTENKAKFKVGDQIQFIPL
jgi:KipI family sensor histidine kinase inhibitor